MVQSPCFKVFLALTCAVLLTAGCATADDTSYAVAGQTVTIALGNGIHRNFLVPPNHKYIVRKSTSDVRIEDHTPPASVTVHERLYMVEGSFVRSIAIH